MEIGIIVLAHPGMNKTVTKIANSSTCTLLLLVAEPAVYTEPVNLQIPSVGVGPCVGRVSRVVYGKASL